MSPSYNGKDRLLIDIYNTLIDIYSAPIAFFV